MEKLGLLTDGASETVKHRMKKQEGGFLSAMITLMAPSLIGPMASSLMQPIAPSLINSITIKGQEGGFLPSLALFLIMKVLRKAVRVAKRGHMNKILVSLHPLNNITITNYLNYEPRFNDVFSRNNLP